MTDTGTPKRRLIEGRPALIVIDIQQSAFVEKEVRAIPHMPDYAERVARARFAIDRAREVGIPVVFIQEIHRADLVDFGRELDGSEDIHCLDSNPETALAKEVTGFREGDYLIQKRRYSAFYGTDLEILLRGLRADTLLLTGGLTDVRPLHLRRRPSGRLFLPRDRGLRRRLQPGSARSGAAGDGISADRRPEVPGRGAGRDGRLRQDEGRLNDPTGAAPSAPLRHPGLRPAPTPSGEAEVHPWLPPARCSAFGRKLEKFSCFSRRGA